MASLVNIQPAGKQGADVAVGEGPIPHLRHRLILYWRPLLALIVAVPFAVYAIVCSAEWFAAPFPGFLVMENGVIPTVGGSDWPPDKGRLFHAQVVAVDGRPVTSSTAIYGAVAALPVGTVFTYTLRRDDAVITQSVGSMAFTPTAYVETYGILFVFGLICLASGIVVGFLQPSNRAARIYLTQAMISGCYACSAVFLHRPGFPVLGRLCLVLECLFAASWIHFSLVFPIERRFRGWWRLVPALPYAVSGLLALLVLTRFFATPPDVAPLHSSYLFNAFALACFIGALVLSYRESNDPLPRLRVKAILAGALICLPWPLLVFAENALTDRRIPVQFALVLTPLGYASLGYAIVKHDLWDIDRIVRRTFAYVVVSIIVLASYASLLEAALRWMPAIGAQGQTLLGMGFVLALALFLEPLRGGVQSVVDAAFFRRRVDYRATIRELSAAMTTLLDLREIVAQVTRVVTDSMQLESMAFALVGADGPSTVWQRSAGGDLQPRAVGPEVAALAHAATGTAVIDAAAVAARIDDPVARAAARALLVATQARAVIPVSFQGRSIGVLLLGARRSGLPLESEMVDLLRTLADQSAIAVQNAHSHAALAALNRDLDRQVRVRTSELREAYEELKSAQAQLIQAEKMASIGQLVAGVAHELNNPASFLYAGLENIAESITHLRAVLEEYEKVPIDDPAVRAHLDAVRQREELASVLHDLPELLSISGEGLERIKRIVDDLRIFARADSGERMPTDVAEGITTSLRLLASQLQRAAIKPVVEAAADLPLIDANAGQLNQVWMNLLSNAIDALANRDHPQLSIDIDVISSDSAARLLRVRIKDNGCGIDPAHAGHLFEPFFTTKPIGAGTGLGLSIAYGAVKAHGGSIDIDSEAGVGTTVVVCLPA